MKYLKYLISPIFMGILFVVFALAMAVATFLENDFGSPAAYSLVYNSFWFELILLLLAVNLVGQLIVFKLFKKSRITGALFHLAFVVMILGAGITRYFGWEGSMHIREGEEQNICYSTEKYIGYTIKASDGKVLESNLQKYSLTSVTADNYNEKLTINNKEYELVLSKVIPNATEPGTMDSEGMGSRRNAFIFILSDGKESSTISIYDRSSEKVSTGSFNVNGTTIEVSYGSKMTTLPFQIRLIDFVL